MELEVSVVERQMVIVLQGIVRMKSELLASRLKVQGVTAHLLLARWLMGTVLEVWHTLAVQH